MRIYHTPKITAPAWAFDMTNQAHILIGGTTGAGKSVALASLIKALLRFTPEECRFCLIDPKGVELIDYDALPHSVGHFCDLEDIAFAIGKATAIMEERFRIMTARREKVYSGEALYIIIDEYVDLKLAAKQDKRYRPMITDLMRIACKGRAAKVHLVICTQRPTREVIDGGIRACLPCVLALRCASAQESRNLLDRSGAEDLPLHGFAYYMTPSARAIEKVEIPLVTDAEMQSLIAWWRKQA